VLKFPPSQKLAELGQFVSSHCIVLEERRLVPRVELHPLAHRRGLCVLGVFGGGCSLAHRGGLCEGCLITNGSVHGKKGGRGMMGHSEVILRMCYVDIIESASRRLLVVHSLAHSHHPQPRSLH
jgi:hypothetical protein